MPRLFVALEIGAAAERRVAEEQARLAETMRGSSFRWAKRDQLHLTLVFIGEVSEERTALIVELMRDPLPHPRFRFALGGLGAFPPRGAPRALWIAVKSGAEHVIRVQALSRNASRPLALNASDGRSARISRWRAGATAGRPTDHGRPPRARRQLPASTRAP